MSTDPAVEAAQRAWPAVEKEHWRAKERTPPLMIAAAREALAPLRELHAPMPSPWNHLTLCTDCDSGWPCDTAKLIYTSEEL